MSPPDTPRPRRLRPMRVSFVLVVLMLAFAVVGVVWLSASRDTHEIYVANHDLPVYHQIVEGDLRRALVPALPEDAVTAREILLGRYTLEPVKQDRPYRLVALGPMLAGGTLAGLGLVAFEPSIETSLAGNLARGDRVDVLLSATDSARAQDSASLTGVLVVDVRPASDGRAALVLGVSRDDVRTLLVGMGTSRLLVVRIASYTRP